MISVDRTSGQVGYVVSIRPTVRREILEGGDEGGDRTYIIANMKYGGGCVLATVETYLTAAGGPVDTRISVCTCLRLPPLVLPFPPSLRLSLSHSNSFSFGASVRACIKVRDTRVSEYAGTQ